jgi:nicotinate-nucleotide adenylyltransferase
MNKLIPSDYRKQIGIYGGSFDPIHNGHLNIALEILEAHQLDEVWLCPTFRNPLKEHSCFATEIQRLEMVMLAIENIPLLKASAIDLYSKSPSYTINLIYKIIQQYKDDSNIYSLIISEDVAYDFYKWQKPEEIIKYVRLLVGIRTKEMSFSNIKGSPSVIEAIKRGYTPHSNFDISSTYIRSRLAKGLSCIHLLPSTVLNYIIKHKLYATTTK